MRNFFSRLSPWSKLCVIFAFGFVTPPLLLGGRLAYCKIVDTKKRNVAGIAANPPDLGGALYTYRDFENLEPEQKHEIAATWISAHKNFDNHVYIDAERDIKKIHAVLPSGYKDSWLLFDHVVEALQTPVAPAERPVNQ